MLFGAFEVLDPPPDPYPFCVKTPVIGTMEGAYVSCAVTDPAGDFAYLPGFSLFNLGPVVGDFSSYLHEWIETRGGKPQLYTLGVSDFNTQLQAWLSRIQPTGTGRFAGATGVLAGVPIWETHDLSGASQFFGNMRVTGYLCTP